MKTYPSRCCAISRAVQRKFRTSEVGWAYAEGEIKDREVYVVSEHSRIVRDFVREHDSGGTVSPFKFELVFANERPL